MGDTWEWDLDATNGGATIRARIEMPARIESVWLGKRLVSRSAAGGKGQVHIIPLPSVAAPLSAGEVYRKAPAAREAEVLFDAMGADCTLRIDGAVIPATRNLEGEAPPPSSLGEAIARGPRTVLGMPAARLAIYAGATCFVIGALAGPGVFRHFRQSRLRAKIAAVETETARTDSITAPDNSIAAHYPGDFDPVVDPAGATISLHRPAKHEMIVLISSPRTDLDDPRDLDRIMMKELETFATRNDAKMTTTITVPGTCQGFPGTISTQTMSKPDSADDIPQKVVGCSMLRAGRGYFFAYFVPEFLADIEEPELKKITDATDIYDMPAPRVATFIPPTSATVNVFVNQPSERFSPTPSPFPQQRTTTFSARGTVTTTGPVPQRTIVRSNGNNLPTPAPVPTVRMVNGVAETSGQAYVYGVNPAADAERERKARAYRERVPW